MGTINSGIQAKLTMDIAPWEKSLRDAEKAYKDAAARIVRTQGVDFRSKDHSMGKAFTGNTANDPARLLKMPEAAKAYGEALQKNNATLYVNGKLVSDVAAAQAKSASASGNMSQGLLQVSYALDDLQYGFKGIANNIPSVLTGLGMVKWAGLVSVMATVGYTLYGMIDKITGATAATERLKRVNDDNAASYAKLSAAMVAAATAWGKAEGEYEMGQLRRQQALRTRQDDEMARRQRLLSLDAKMAMVETERMGEFEAKAAKLSIITAEETEKAELELKVATERAELDKATMGETRKRLEETQREIALIEARIKAKEKEFNLEKAREKLNNERMEDLTNRSENKFMGIGPTYRNYERLKTNNYQGDFQPGKADAARLAGLKELLPALKSKADELDTRSGESNRKRENAEQKLKTEIPKDTAIALRQIEIEIAAYRARKFWEMVQQGINTVTGSFTDIGKAFTDAEKHVQAWRKEQLGGFANGIQKAFDSLLESGRNAIQRIQDRRAENLRQQADTRMDLAISEIRSPRRRARVQRAKDLADTTRRLQEEEGFSPAEAADIAARRQRVQDRANGDRTIRSTEPARQYQGLDAYRNSRFGESSFPNSRQSGAARGSAALRKAAEEAARVKGNDPGKMVAQILTKLDQLIQATEKTPADKLAPMKRN